MKNQNNKNNTIDRSSHFLDSIEEDSLLDKNTDTEKEFEEELEQEEEIEQEEEQEEIKQQEENEESDIVTFAPFLQELIDSDILVVPEGKEYDDSESGFKEIIDDNVLLKYEGFKNDLINPTSVAYLEFLEAGGHPEDYINRASEIPDYANADLEDVDTQKNLIADNLHIQEWDQEDIEAQVAEYEEIGSLAKQAAIAQKYLVKYAEKELVNITKQQQISEQQRVKSLQKEAEELRNSIYKSDSIGGFKLTKTERDKLYDYITKPVKKENGRIYTQNLLDDSNETKTALAYYKMKKFSFKDIENKVETKKASELQNQLRKRSDKLISKNNLINSEEESNANSVLKGWDFLSR